MMPNDINVKVSGYSLTKDGTCAGAQYEANSTHLIIEFGSDWDNFSKTVTFWDAVGGNPTKIDLYAINAIDKNIYSVPVPGEVTKRAGMITFVIDGYSEGKSVIKRSVEDKLKVLPSRKSVNADNASTPTPDQMQQLQSSIAAIENEIIELNNNTENAQFYAGEAAKSEGNASGSATAAAQSATAAAQSAGAAAQSELDASNHEANAQGHEVVAYNHKEDAKGFASLAKDYAEKAELAAGKTVYVGENGNWFRWDSDLGEFVDTGVNAVSGNIVGTSGDEIDVVVKGDEQNTVKISANIKQGSISKDKVDNTIITEDDYASPTRAGVVNLAEPGLMGPKKSNWAITEHSADVAVGLATHQNMSDSYNPLDFKTCTDMVGRQDELPVGYKAVKEYVDNVADEKADKLDTYTKADVDAKVKNAEVKEGSIELKHLSDEVLDNLGGGSVDLSNYLRKDNEEEYTPASNYNPATKKYVDDATRVAIQNTANFGGQIARNENDIRELQGRLDSNYYNKNEVQNEIAKIDVPQIDGEKSKTDTIAVFEDVRTEVIEANENGVVNLTVYPREDSGVVQYIFEFDTLPTDVIEVFTVDVDGNDTFDATNPTTINVNDPKYEQYGGISSIHISSYEGTSRVTVTKVYGDAFLKADIEKGSIEMLHLSDDVKNLYVKNTDYATNKTAGVVKTSASDGVGINDGNLYLAYAGTDEINKKNGGRAIVPFTIDHAISKGTHQTMADDYEPITLKVASNMSGNQGQLPASYDAVKGYIDSSISDLIEKLKAAGVNID